MMYLACHRPHFGAFDDLSLVNTAEGHVMFAAIENQPHGVVVVVVGSGGGGGGGFGGWTGRLGGAERRVRFHDIIRRGSTKPDVSITHFLE